MINYDSSWAAKFKLVQDILKRHVENVLNAKYAAIERFLLQNQADPNTHTTVYFPEVQTETDNGHHFSQRIGLAPQGFEQFSEDWPSFIFEYEIITRS